MKINSAPSMALTTILLSGLAAVPAFSQTAAAPYQLSVFATAPSGLSAPDSIAVYHDHVFVGYGDGHAPDGSDGLNTQVVEFDKTGKAVYTYTVPGHNDGLKLNPHTQELWALQNEDANANLVVINPETHEQRLYLFGPTLHGGGYDDLVFRGCKVFVSASNPAKNPNTGPAIVSVHLAGKTVEIEPVLAGEANATNLLTDVTAALNLQDPDSMTMDPEGNLVLDSQGDDELIIVSKPGTPAQTAVNLPLSYGGSSTEVDDTAFVTATEGYILFADKQLNNVYRLKKVAFAPGAAYTAADAVGAVGTLDLTTGVISPVVTGLGAPGGLVFVNTAAHSDNDDHHDDRGDSCRDNDR